jgi:hypothetical protein
MTLSRPFIQDFCNARIESLQSLEQAYKDKFFTKKEKDWIKDMIIQGTEESLMLGDERAREYLDRYAPAEDPFKNGGHDSVEDFLDELFNFGSKEQSNSYDEDNRQDSFHDQDFFHENTPKHSDRSKSKDSEGEIKSIYRDLIKAFHPDREMDEELKLKKTALTQEITEAYKKKDLHQLLKFEMEHAKSLEATTEKLAIYIRELNEKIKKLKSEKKKLTKFGPLTPFYEKFYSRKTNEIDKKIQAELKSLEERVWSEQAFGGMFNDHKRFRTYLKNEFGHNVKKSKSRLSAQEAMLDDVFEMFEEEMLQAILSRSPLNKRRRAKSRA